MRPSFRIRFSSCVAMLALAIAMAIPASPASASLQKLVYQIRHPTYGRIGTYTNAIEKMGNETKVTSVGQIRVSILGIVLYRQDFSRIEDWIGDRLMSFHGVTTVNGNSTEVNGAAEGDHFVVNSPNGTATAPAMVRIANPWSTLQLSGDTMITPDRGFVENVVISPEEKAAIALKGKTVNTHHYQINRTSGERRYEVWFDDEGTPLMFNVNGRNGLVTFMLDS